MAKKRSVFDINFTPEDAPAPEVKSAIPPAPSEARRGPMAAAISENADALNARSEAEAAIRAENDALAHEHVRLKKLGLITDLVPLDKISVKKLTRDRAIGTGLEVDDLIASIQAVGLSNPIRLEPVDGGYELVQGLRRLTAYAALLKQTLDDRYLTIPAVIMPRGMGLQDLYQTMVDENLIRKDVSFAEMAAVSQGAARDLEMDAREAVDAIFGSASRQKRAYIKSFVRLLDLIGRDLRHAAAMPRALGLDLLKRIEMEPRVLPALQEALRGLPDDRSEATELKVLRNALLSKFVETKRRAAPVSKTTMRLPRAEGEAKVPAASGRLELRQERDFSAIDRAKLEAALAAFLDALKD